MHIPLCSLHKFMTGQMGDVAKKPVFWVSDQVMLKPVHSASKRNYILEILHSTNLAMPLIRLQMSRWSETLLDATARSSHCMAKMTLTVVLSKKIAQFFGILILMEASINFLQC